MSKRRDTSSELYLDNEGLNPLQIIEIGVNSALNRKLMNIVEKPYKGDPDYKPPLNIENEIDKFIKKG